MIKDLFKKIFKNKNKDEKIREELCNEIATPIDHYAMFNEIQQKSDKEIIEIIKNKDSRLDSAVVSHLLIFEILGRLLEKNGTKI